MDGVTQVVKFLSGGVPNDWRYPDPDFLHSVSPERLDLVQPGLILVNHSILEYVARNPARFHGLTPRQFEEVVAELMDHLGYEVELTPASKDGGVDIWAARNDLAGRFLYAVQCKKRSPGEKVGVVVVRELYGAVERERATAGIVATTAYFTRGAREEQQRVANRMSLLDFDGLVDWLGRAGLTAI